jgi:hypothetical protein
MGFASRGLLRTIAYAFCTFGLIEGLVRVRSLNRRLVWLAQSLRTNTKTEWLGFSIGSVTMLTLGFTALGPVTDADSLAYHLGIPLDWLRFEGIPPQTDWVFARLAGFGESINLIGLASGTDCLGAVFQWLGGVLAITGLWSMARNARNQVLAILLVSSTPVVLFLIPNQKAQLLPAAATMIALLIVVKAKEQFVLKEVILVAACLAFAIGCKQSFLFSAVSVAAISIGVAYRSHRLLQTVLVGSAVFFTMLLPLLVQRYVTFGDPLSPVFETFKSTPDPTIVAFGEMLRNFVRPHSTSGVLGFLVGLVIPANFASFSTILGVGVFSILCLENRSSSVWLLTSASLFTSVLSVSLGSLEPRYLLEPYFWMAAAVVSGGENWQKTVLSYTLYLQGFCVFGAALYGAITLFPGALSRNLRERTMVSQAAGYRESRWLDRVLPQSSVYATTSRYAALAPRSFVVLEPQFWGVKAKEKAVRLMSNANVDSLIIYGARKTPIFILGKECGTPIASSTFPLVARNPWHAERTYKATIWDVRNCW